jgi:hypothetical protein
VVRGRKLTNAQLKDKIEDLEAKLEAKEIVREIHNDRTMYKVYFALKNAGWNEDNVDGIITALQNEGILFRERA